MAKLDLSKVGNFPDYKHEPRLVRPLGLITTPLSGLVLKFYYITTEEDYSLNSAALQQSAAEFIMNEAESGRIAPLSGLGFAILSEDTLNVARWRSESNRACVPVNQCYEYSSSQGYDFKVNPKSLDINVEGAFCGWELGIVAHETRSWMKYLASKRSEADKRLYLRNQIAGRLWSV